MLWKGLGLNWAFRITTLRSFSISLIKIGLSIEVEWGDWRVEKGEWHFVKYKVKLILDKRWTSKINCRKDEFSEFWWTPCSKETKQNSQIKTFLNWNLT